MARHTARGAITRHYGISAPATLSQADRLAKAVTEHQLPERGASPSTDRMLDAIDAILTGDGGNGYDGNKAYDWARRFPLRTTAAQVEQDWEQRYDMAAVAELVLMHGHSPARAALEYGTTPATVDVIVAAYKMKIKRGG